MSISNNMEFTTYDADHDIKLGGNCADYYGGGFWFKDCGSNINGPYSQIAYYDYQIWRRYSLKKIQLMIRPAGKNLTESYK